MSERKEWKVSASAFAARTNNPIRTLVESLNIEPHPEKQMIALSIGDPTTFGNLLPPEEAITAIRDSAESCSNNGYAPASGFVAARKAVAEYSSINGLRVEASDVIFCSGCSSALDLCISVIANPGQNILIPRPGFSIYQTLAEGLGIEVRHYDLLMEKGWEADLDHLEKEIDNRTACIIVNNPSNPCGSVYSITHLKDIINIAEKHFLPIISDEIYEHLVFPGSEFYPLASLSTNVPILSCSGLAKRFLVPGWRTGWIVIHDRNGVFTTIREGLTKLSQRVMGSNTLVQGAIPALLRDTPTNFYKSTIKTLYTNALYLYDRLSMTPGLRPVMPQGAMYMMVGIDIQRFPNLKNGISFVERLVAEESVFCLPGDCFQYPNYVRIVLTAPENMLSEACDRIENFCCHHYRRKDKIEMSTRNKVLVRGEPRSNDSGRQP